MKRFFPYLAAGLAMALLAGVFNGAARVHRAYSTAAFEPFLDLPSGRPAHDPGKPTAVVVIGNHGAEITDTLPPYELLARSGVWNVYLAAPERAASPFVNGMLFGAGLSAIPHYSFADLRNAGLRPDLVVVPYLPEFQGADRPVVPWLKEQAANGASFLTICAGSRVLAESGVLDGKRAASAHRGLDRYRRERPAVRWEGNRRWVEDGAVISSSTLAAGIDATLHAIDRHAGRGAAVRVMKEMGYRHGHYLDNPAFDPPSLSPIPILETAFRFRDRAMAVRLENGAGETAIAAVLDSWPLTLAHPIRTIGAPGRLVRTAHGAWLVAAVGADSSAVEETIAPPPDTGVFPYDAALMEMAGKTSRPMARAAAAGLVYPDRRLALPGTALPWDLLAAAFFWMAGGAALARLFHAWRRARVGRGSGSVTAAHPYRTSVA
jgi:putative intracellular protease/amidase